MTVTDGEIATHLNLWLASLQSILAAVLAPLSVVSSLLGYRKDLIYKALALNRIDLRWRFKKR